MTFHVAGAHSSLDRDRMAPGTQPQHVIEVPVRALDDILAEVDAPKGFDFLSIDVEGHELEVLSGFDLARWRPRLILLEDHVANLNKHRFLRNAGYRLIRRFEYNGWYVPREANVRVASPDRWEIVRKYYLGLPFRIARNASRRVRQPFKDRRRLRPESTSKVILSHKRRPLNRHPEELGALLCAPSVIASRLQPTCALKNPTSGKPEVGGGQPRPPAPHPSRLAR
jgi:hypothetical protein